MGILLSTCAAQGVCEASTCALGLGTRCCCATLSKSTRSRVTYLGLFLVLSFVSWVLSNWAAVVLPFVPVLKNLPWHLGGASAVTRVMAALAAFHLGMAGILIGVKEKNSARASVQNSFWIVKFALVALLIFAFFSIPNDGLAALGWIAFTGATLFLLLQILLLITFAASWNESWADKWEADDPNGWYCAHLSSTLGLFVFTFAVSIAMYVLYVSQCPLNSLFITVNILASLANAFISLLPAVREKTPNSGLLQAGVIAERRGLHLQVGRAAAARRRVGLADVVAHFGVLFSIAAVCYSAIRLSVSDSDIEGLFIRDGDNDDDTTVLLLDDYDGAASDADADANADADADADADANTDATAKSKAKDEEAGSADDVDAACAYNYSFFHLTFALAAFYMCMLLSNWMVLSHADNASSGLRVNSGSAAVWVKVVTSWVTHALYAWSLMAPVLFPTREFA
ncbi:membrane protein TMS1 [Thecamonas trahens ATCC 50062]|uniref:Membrane protein TMS1 n=1 Tax=Thecamonas trahens ATCC 50062 TaxID=461836 RepID=A0A0L0DDK3_THETB|nr:membrane protein TMS1 [Thecamonas trahens ATCC 50062]KNC50300.1 membrane protein TMS1 [Thecamonas trahens ATCC 50062]|eukprot:XP_013756847.1 membrane protein TMS1 [Thecamonas trahens ATCC 50062]